ncbi:hypothetical protein HPB50_009889 [Hyalomma asiaticum]|uniref:Uncharacterized protein n=1 Tax=Hyalomma asiaticum TaxID=266040 RepID=A0ACB7RIM7_HYAAI|nr:hypothetical protein HPB50_009889 [Hyalomma asiaticum]
MTKQDQSRRRGHGAAFRGSVVRRVAAGRAFVEPHSARLIFVFDQRSSSQRAKTCHGPRAPEEQATVFPRGSRRRLPRPENVAVPNCARPATRGEEKSGACSGKKNHVGSKWTKRKERKNWSLFVFVLRSPTRWLVFFFLHFNRYLSVKGDILSDVLWLHDGGILRAPRAYPCVALSAEHVG